MPKRPPTRDQVLDQLRRTTPTDYHEPFLTDPGGAIAQYRGLARTLSELAEVVSRSTTRQFFIAPPGFESAGFGTRATMTIEAQRAADLDRPLIIMAGSLSMVGPRGRVYRNSIEITWYPFDPEPLRSIPMQCDLIGEPGNLDAWADDDGFLTDPVTGGPLLSLVDIEALSQGRAGLRGVLTVASGSPSVLTVDGTAPTFAPSDVGLFVYFNSAGDPANVGRMLRITSWSIADTPVDGYYPRTITLDDTLQIGLVTAAILDDGGVFTDYTAEAKSGAAGSVPLLPVAPAVNDAFYFGSDAPFAEITITISNRRYGDLTLTWEYWDGAIWAALADLVDGSEVLTIVGRSNVGWTIPGAWATTTVDGRNAYYVRARVSAFVSAIEQPLASLIETWTPAPPLVADPLDANGFGQIGWMVMDFRDIGLEIVTMTAAAGGRDDDLGLKLAERQLQRRPGEGIDTLRRRASRFPDVVTPEAIEWEINRILEPFGLAGQVCDLGHGFTGLFFDVPVTEAPAIVSAFDLYEPGDVFPEDDTLLPLSEEDSRWKFWVKVPDSNLGEFGSAWDEGPPAIYVDAFGTFIGSAYDFAFFDGYPATAAALYMLAYERVLEAKAGGIAVEFIRGDVPVCP